MMTSHEFKSSHQNSELCVVSHSVITWMHPVLILLQLFANNRILGV